jgi:hypothetical protein
MADVILAIADERVELRTEGDELLVPHVAAAIAARNGSLGAQRRSELAAETALASSRYYPTRAAGDAATPLDQAFATDDAAGNLVYYRRTGGGSIEIARAVTPANLASPDGARRVGFSRRGAGATKRDLEVTLAAYEVTPEQFGAVGDGIADDAPALQLALDDIKRVATSVAGQTRPGTLLLTPGARYKCGSGLLIDRAFHNVYGYATLDFSSWTGTYVTVCGSYTEFGNGYGQHGCIEGQIAIVGSGADKPSIGILYESNLSGSSTRMRTVGFSITKCGFALKYGNRGYNQLFVNGEIFDCDTAVWWPADTADADERNNIRDTDIYNCRRAFWLQRAAGCLLNDGGSVDYVDRVHDIENGKYTSNNVHYEASNWKNLPFNIEAGSGSAIFNNGWIVQQQNLGGVTHFFSLGLGSHAKLKNVRTNNTNNILTPNGTTPTTWATGLGRFEMHGTEPAFEFGGFPARQHSGYSLLSDGEFERSILEDPLWIREDDGAVTSRHTGKNIQLSRVTTGQYDGGACLRMDKQSDANTNAAFILIAVPVRYGDKTTAGFRVRTAPDRLGTNRRLIVRAGFAKLDGSDGNRIPVITRFSPPGEVIITPSSTEYSLVMPFNGASQVTAPSWATHYIVDVNAYQAAAASFLFDGLWADRW